MSEHTPGPWAVSHRCIGCGPKDDESAGLGLELVGPPEPALRGQFAKAADALLAAAAPSLFAALERITIEYIEERDCLFNSVVNPRTGRVENINEKETLDEMDAVIQQCKDALAAARGDKP